MSRRACRDSTTTPLVLVSPGTDTVVDHTQDAAFLAAHAAARSAHPLPATVNMPGDLRFTVPPTGPWTFDHGVRPINATLLDHVAGRGHGGARASTYTPRLAQLLRCFLLHQLQHMTPNGVKNYFDGFVVFERWLHATAGWGARPRAFGLAHLTVPVYDAFREWTLHHTGSKGAACRALRAFYRWASAHDGFDAATLRGIERIGLTKAVAGKATRLRDPVRGPFDQWEQEQITMALLHEVGGSAYTVHRLVTAFFREVGARPYALALMERQHLRVIHHPTGGSQYVVDIPRIKKRGTGYVFTETYPMEITARLGAGLAALHADDAMPTTRLIPGLSPRDPTWSIRTMMTEWAVVADLRTNRVRPVDAAPGIVPPYPLQPLTVFPQRYRRTLATNLHEQGYSQEDIAAFLDDTSLAMAVIYVENSATMVDLLSETLDKHPDFIRQIRYFRGEIALIPDESLPEIFGGASWITDYAEFAEMGALGRCATPLPCGFRPPLTCYLCRFFRPTPGAPHAVQLAQIRRESAVRLGHQSDRLLRVLRRVDAAIVQVMVQCDAILAAAAVTPRAKVRAARPGRAPLLLTDATHPSTASS